MIIAIVYNLELKPGFEHYRSVQGERASLQADFARKQLKRSAMDKKFFLQKLDKLEHQFAKLPKCLPSQNALRGAVQDILSKGVGEGLIFELFEPETEVANSLYTELPINIKVFGSYYQLVQFLRHMIKNHSAAHILNFEMAASSKPSEERLQMNMRLIICRIREDEPNGY